MTDLDHIIHERDSLRELVLRMEREAKHMEEKQKRLEQARGMRMAAEMVLVQGTRSGAGSLARYIRDLADQHERLPS